ncbi:helix-turn-helix domain-containing protein, partial [Paenibacillus sp. Soil522]|uniref:helix-turn-helix domain-containing protein n=1 Tax=Paenibacillus sp. Soil522 TaxID=1736388 RepID=UPI000A89B3BC
MSRVQYNAKEKLAIIEEIDSGELSVMAVAYKYGISKTTLVKWRRQYEVYGFEGLEVQTENRSYSAELKLQAVLDYLEGELSQYDIIDKYKIASRTQ